MQDLHNISILLSWRYLITAVRRSYADLDNAARSDEIELALLSILDGDNYWSPV